ncbi:hypothetical protein T492DRAFT_951757 [Pavlovales sp. CCMP2436]|nr:hypothetical protein T492DRAFT_951757 [Pavlovales sp. CCMP2436]
MGGEWQHWTLPASQNSKSTDKNDDDGNTDPPRPKLTTNLAGNAADDAAAVAQMHRDLLWRAALTTLSPPPPEPPPPSPPPSPPPPADVAALGGLQPSFESAGFFCGDKHRPASTQLLNAYECRAVIAKINAPYVRFAWSPRWGYCYGCRAKHTLVHDPDYVSLHTYEAPFYLKPACESEPGWRDAQGANCARYGNTSTCLGGKLYEPEKFGGRAHGFPEKACCECGGGKRAPLKKRTDSALHAAARLVQRSSAEQAPLLNRGAARTPLLSRGAAGVAHGHAGAVLLTALAVLTVAAVLGVALGSRRGSVG